VADEVLLDVKNLTTTFATQDGIVHAVNGISFSVRKGEAVGIVGESGCGKSVSMLSILRLLKEPPAKVSAEKIQFMGRDMLHMPRSQLRKVRGNLVSMVFQDPMTSFNPVLPIGFQLREPLHFHWDYSKEEANQRVLELLELVGIPDAKARLDDYPHQFSGGMRQRAMIAMALACNPGMLIADEPTTALDVTIQAQIIELVKELRDKIGMALIWITHDLGVVAGLAERVIVMYAGFIVEEAAVSELYNNPRHPYTIALLGSLPRLDVEEERQLDTIEGLPPDLFELPPGCAFYDRCNFRQDKCMQHVPQLEEVAPNHRICCWVDVEHGGLR